MKTQKGTLRLTGTGENDIRLQSECVMISEDGQMTIEFDESLAGLDGTKSVIVISDDAMTLNRTGDYESCLVFEQGREMPVTVGSPYGRIELVLKTRKLDIVRTDKGVTADVEYVFCLGENQTLRNGLHLECGAEGESRQEMRRSQESL